MAGRARLTDTLLLTLMCPYKHSSFLLLPVKNASNEESFLNNFGPYCPIFMKLPRRK